MAYDLGSIFAFSPSSFLTSFFLLFSVVNAIGVVPLYLALTQGVQDKRSQIVRQSTIIATVILLVFAAAGQVIFDLFGITINDFKIAGGIILLIIAIDNLRGDISQMKSTDAVELAAFPLATPLLAGPGAISTVIIYATPPYGLFEDFAVVLLNGLLVYIILSRAALVQRALGRNGTQVFTRIVGLLIAAIGIAFIREGVVAIAQSYLGAG
ncbi:MAG: MarC family protein [Nitrososphaerota archaeon]|nr:MarC family protein [Nitrososphaerota archaeon]MDG6967299.1 MarC family protein [Nitrososphaerota archaeon]MDG6977930.1 MarC family protein [Nitrososphaerota archaeon]MDG7006062.1 MarC family protein [Nitrososphaerota archaeon]MDG7020836.1 MarC family protein [Nitrososphaerota archaeon]